MCAQMISLRLELPFADFCPEFDLLTNRPIITNTLCQTLRIAFVQFPAHMNIEENDMVLFEVITTGDVEEAQKGNVLHTL